MKERKKRKKLGIIVAAVLASISMMPLGALACTGVYVGEKVSEEGTTIIARSEDAHPLYNPTRLEYVDAKDTAGKTYEQAANGFKWKYPDKTFGYVCSPQWECNVAEDGRYAAYAMNQKGLNVTATITGYVCKEAREADPYEENGIAEEGITDILGASCKTAREAVELLADICDEYGSAESNILMVNDKKEAWYMEIYTGHQYAAVKMPSDRIAVFGNEFMLENLEDYDEVIASPELETLPEQAGFAEYDEDGRMDLFDTYAGKGRLKDYSNLRTWYGHYVFSPSTAGEYNTLTKYPLFFKPDQKIAVTDVMELFRSRFEGTEYDADVADSTKARVIGTETQQTVHILQMFKDLPDDRCSIGWTTLSQAECAVFLPVFSCMKDFQYAFTKDNAECVMDDEAAYSVYKELNTLCSIDRSIYKPAVTEYWQNVEKYIVKTSIDALIGSKELSDSSAYKYLTAYGIKAEKAAFEDAKVLNRDILRALAENTDTFQGRFHYDTLTSTPLAESEQAEISLKEEDIKTKYAIDDLPKAIPDESK